MKPLVASYCSTFLKPEMQHIYRQVTGLRRYRTFVVCKERSCAEQYPYADIEIQPRVRKNFIRRFWLKYVRKAPAIVYRGEYMALSPILDGRGADLMHIYFGHTGVHLLPFILRWEKPCVVSFHGMDIQPRANKPGYLQNLKAMLQVLPLVLARSESLAERLVELGCPEGKIRLNRTGVPLDAFPEMQRAAPTDGAWRFIQSCRLIEKKGLDVALKAFAGFLQHFPQSTFTIAGEGPLEAPLKAMCAELGISQSVQFTGFLQERPLCQLLQQSHVFVHPSQITADLNQEGVPNSMLEAMSTGLPVLATYHGGIPEAVSHGQNGLLVPERDTKGLLDSMLHLAHQPDLWQKLGHQAAQDMQEKFERNKATQALEAIYDEAISLGKPG